MVPVQKLSNSTSNYVFKISQDQLFVLWTGNTLGQSISWRHESCGRKRERQLAYSRRRAEVGQLLIPCILLHSFTAFIIWLKLRKIFQRQTRRENIIFIGVSIKISYSIKWNNGKEAAIDENGGSWFAFFFYFGEEISVPWLSISAMSAIATFEEYP